MITQPTSAISFSTYVLPSDRESGRTGVCGMSRPKFMVTLASESEAQSTDQPFWMVFVFFLGLYIQILGLNSNLATVSVFIL